MRDLALVTVAITIVHSFIALAWISRLEKRIDSLEEEIEFSKWP